MSESRAGRIAVVLGGTQGIGKEIVKTLAANGTTVYLSVVRKTARTQRSRKSGREP